jgi:ABC-type sugar transport system substrate-binding protein
MKKVLGLLLAASVLLCAAAPAFAGGQSEVPKAKKTSKDKLKVYVVSVMSGGAAWGQCEKGFFEACQKLGWEGHYLAPSSPNADTEMVNLLETAITNGADVLFPVVTNEDMFADVLIRARERGIPTVAIAGGSEKYCDVMVGTDPISLGRDCAEALARALQGKPINVAPMQTTITNSVQNIQRQAFEDRLKELRPDAVIVERLDCNSNASIAADKFAALKMAHPELNSMISLDSYAGLGAAAFVEEKGLKGQFVVVGIDDAPEILRAIQAGTMTCTVAQMWYQMGGDAVGLAVRLVDGEKLKYNNSIGTAQIFPEDVASWVAKYNIDMSSK